MAAKLSSRVSPWPSVGSRFPLIFLPLFATACLLSYDRSLGDNAAAVKWWVQGEVEAGIVQGEVPEAFAGNRRIFNPRHMWRSWATHLMILVGWFHRPAHERFTTMFDIFSHWEPSDPEGQFCRKVLEYCWRPQSDGVTCESADVKATSRDVHDFIRACRDAYTCLGEEERTLLDPYRTAGLIPKAVLNRFADNSRLDRRQPKVRRRLRKNFTEAKTLSREGLVEVLNESLRASALSEIIPSPPEEVVNVLSTFDLREVPLIHSDWAEVGRAVRSSLIVRFDSTLLLPREVFNISMEQLARNEGPAAERIPVFSNECAPMSLRSYAALAERHVQSGKRNLFSFAHWRNVGLEPPPEVTRGVNYLERSSLEASNASWCSPINMNARRLPKFFSLLPHRLEEDLGLEEEVLRMQPFFWMGPVEYRVHHHDEESAVYIQFSGHSDVYLLPQSQTDFWGARNSNSRNFSLNDPALRMVPLFLVHLRPGDGLVIPGRSYHDFLSQSSDRIALSMFLQPKWRKMEFSTDDWYSREAGKELGLEHLALRQLYIRSFIRLYEETGKGIIFQHYKNELL